MSLNLFTYLDVLDKFNLFIITDEVRVTGDRKVKGVGVMEDKEVNLKETEPTHTLGGGGEGRVQWRGKGIGCRCSSSYRVIDTSDTSISPSY